MNIQPKFEGRNADLIADATTLGVVDKIIYTDSEDKLEFFKNTNLIYFLMMMPIGIQILFAKLEV
ncbi:hypothetical protein OBJ93_11430 [Empedobacter falsenii]